MSLPFLAGISSLAASSSFQVPMLRCLHHDGVSTGLAVYLSLFLHLGLVQGSLIQVVSFMAWFSVCSISAVFGLVRRMKPRLSFARYSLFIIGGSCLVCQCGSLVFRIFCFWF